MFEEFLKNRNQHSEVAVKDLHPGGLKAGK
jgi:hypothetical protein